MTDETTLDLGSLFGAALQAMTANRQQVNDLDGYNGNHGNNMVENLRIITDAVSARDGQSPADALRYAGQELQSQGRGGTSQYYAQGLAQAAEQLQGRSELGKGDVMSLVQTLLGAVPSQGDPQQAGAGGSVLEQVLGSVAQDTQGASALEQVLGLGTQDTQGASALGQVLGALPGAQQPGPEPQEDGLGLDDVLQTLLPAGLAFLQAKQTGADTTAAAGQALVSVLMGGQANPLQAGTPRAAAGGLVAQSILRALLNRR